MIFIILFFLVIIISILLRDIINRRKKTFNYADSKRLTVWIFMYWFIYAGLIAFFITDVSVGFIYTLLSFFLYTIIFFISNKRSSLLNSLILIMGIPVTFIILVKSFEYILIDVNYVFLLIIIPWTILSGEFHFECSVSNFIPIAVGIGIAFYILLVPYDIKNNYDMVFQKLVAEEYLIRELNITPDYVRADRKLRGLATEVRAYCSTNDLKITMIYRNGKIESYQLE